MPCGCAVPGGGAPGTSSHTLARAARLNRATAANGLPAFGHYKPSAPGGAYQPWALLVLELSGDGDTMAIDLWAADGHDVHANVRRALVDAAHGAAGPCDVRRGLMVQRLVDRAERQLRS